MTAYENGVLSYATKNVKKNIASYREYARKKRISEGNAAPSKKKSE